MELTLKWDGTLELTENTKPPALPEVTFQGLTICIENDVGSTRSGKKPDGSPWSVTMTWPYGYIKDTSCGMDQEGVDCFLGPDPAAKSAYIIRTREPSTGTSDEDKCFLGFSASEHAKSAFYDNFDDPRYFDGMSEMPMADFKTWIGQPRSRPPVQLADKRPIPTVFLVRHAHSSDNGTDDPSTQIVRGSRDVEPDAQGLAEAERIGQEFSGVPVSKIYTSGKKRARIVADAIARVTNAPVEINPAAESWNRGSLEGQPVSAVLDDMQHYAENPDEVPPGGVSRNSWLSIYGADLRARLTEAEAANSPLVYVTHLSNILATPAVVTGDRDLLPFPGDKVRTCEMLALTKPGKDWRWKKYVHLSDRLSPIDFPLQRRMIDAAAAGIHRVMRDAMPGTRLLASDYIRGFSRTPENLEDLNNLLVARMPVDDGLSASIARLVQPLITLGRDSVYTEYKKFLGRDADAPIGTGVITPSTPPQLQTPWAVTPSALGKHAAFNFATWVLSREMSQEETSEPTDSDEPEFSLEADLLQQALSAAGLPLRQLAREIAMQALCEGRKMALQQLKDHVHSIRLVEGLWAGEFV